MQRIDCHAHFTPTEYDAQATKTLGLDHAGVAAQAKIEWNNAATRVLRLANH
jgi:hypothetical protein